MDEFSLFGHFVAGLRPGNSKEKMNVTRDGSETIADHNPNGRVLAFRLVLIHFAAGLICCVVIRSYHSRSYQAAAFIGLVLGQASLLGLWAGLGTGAWLARLVVALVGLVCLGVLFCVGGEELAPELVLMIVFAGLSVAGVLAVCRWFGLRIRRVGVDTSHKIPTQFSIRQLMLLTLVVACVMASAKWLTPHVDMDGRTPKLFLIPLPFLVLGFVAVWGILRTEHPRLGMVAVLLLAQLLGPSLKAVLGRGWMDAGYWIAATTTTAFVLVISLYIIRRCGFRVTRRPKGELPVEGDQSHKEEEAENGAENARKKGVGSRF